MNIPGRPTASRSNHDRGGGIYTIQKQNQAISRGYMIQSGICLNCEGSGTRFIFFDCGTCGGSGKVSYCQGCGGSGSGWFFKCKYCNGTG